MKLSEEEKKILESVEKEEWKSVKGAKEKVKKYREYARSTFRKDKRVNIRISEKDLIDIQKRAMEEGLPYQTLMSSILHKYVTGRLVDKNS
jgi:predicted DNA binding CopG/RHH family protein